MKVNMGQRVALKVIEGVSALVLDRGREMSEFIIKDSEATGELAEDLRAISTAFVVGAALAALEEMASKTSESLKRSKRSGSDTVVALFAEADAEEKQSRSLVN